MFVCQKMQQFHKAQKQRHSISDFLVKKNKIHRTKTKIQNEMVIEKSKANDNARICGKSCYADLQTRSKSGQRCKQRENPRTKFCNFF